VGPVVEPDVDLRKSWVVSEEKKERDLPLVLDRPETPRLKLYRLTGQEGMLKEKKTCLVKSARGKGFRTLADHS